MDRLTDFSRLCVHTITTKPWSIEEASVNFSDGGVKGITIWKNTLEGRDIGATGRMIRDRGLQIVSLCRGGFFPSTDPVKRRYALDENRQIIDEAHALGAPLIVLVCGADPAQPLEESRKQIREGIQAILPHAQQAGVKLAIEPLHPMYAADRSAVNTLAQANEMAAAIDSPWVGVAIDVYHLWWDPALETEINKCGQMNKLFAFHICDWKINPEDMLNDRGLMGEGCIDIPKIRSWIEAAGFNGFIEVEIFSNRYWAMDQHQFLSQIKEAYLNS